jgi:hypothetical protein
MLKYLRKIRKRHYVILALLLAIYLGDAMCTSPQEETNPPIRNAYGQAFAGSALRRNFDPRSSPPSTFAQGSVACMSCHREIYESHIQTAHYHDSRPATKEFIKGSFEAGRNRFVYSTSVEVAMEQKDSGFFQTAFLNGKQYRSEPFGIVTGSGRKGQTYLYWNDGKLFQLPVSYFTPSDSWCNSPGYGADSPRFNRPITSYCLECHSTNVRTLFRSNKDYGDFFDPGQIIYGIDCERCHGPAAEHVAFHTAHPGEKSGKYIVNTRLLSRQQRLDACALCNSGSRFPLKPAFSFRAGDRLDDFSEPKFSPENVSTLDVHGNQYGLLTSSKCFRQSQMDCSSCHNVHVNEAGSVKLFSQRCMSCHNGTDHPTCTVTPAAGLVLGDNCIDCHMPALASQKIVLGLSNVSGTGQAISNLVRTHHIAVYAESTKEYLKKMKKENGGPGSGRRDP